MNIKVLFDTMMVLFGIIILGYFINKVGILDERTNNKLSELVIKVTCPMLIISSVLNKAQIENKKEIFKILFLGFILYGFLILFSKIILKLFRLKDKNYFIYEMLIIFCNMGFMGYPIVRVIYGEQAVFPFSILHIPFNILIYSYGIYLINKNEDRNKQEKVKIKYKVFFNPGIIAAIIALIIFSFEIKLPEFLGNLFYIVGESTVPFSMILIGSSLAMIPLKDIFKDYKICIVSLVKLILLPFVIYLISELFISNKEIIGYLILSGALPSGSTIVMLANQYNKGIKTASLGVFITTALSIITIPITVVLFLN